MGRPARPTKGKKKDRRLLVDKVRKKEGARVSDLETRLAGALKRGAEALAQQTATSEVREAVQRSARPVSADSDGISARVIRTRGVVHVADVLSDETYDLKEEARGGGWRAGLGVPIL